MLGLEYISGQLKRLELFLIHLNIPFQSFSFLEEFNYS